MASCAATRLGQRAPAGLRPPAADACPRPRVCALLTTSVRAPLQMLWKGADPPTTTATGDGTDTAGLERGEGAADFGLAGKEATATPPRYLSWQRLAAFSGLAVLAGAAGGTIVLLRNRVNQRRYRQRSTPQLCS